jgi:hypothetical protein
MAVEKAANDYYTKYTGSILGGVLSVELEVI